MGLILLEALLALVILLAIVWWTMFYGRNKGELPPSASKPTGSPSDDTKT
jgi:cytoskeletal protein RodZ